MNWPSLTMPEIIVPFSPLSLFPQMTPLASTGVTLNAFAGAAWPVANQAFYCPFLVTQTFTARLMFTLNGATASDSIDVGIYSEDGTRLVSGGGAAQSGTDTIQTFDITDTVLGPGKYFMAMAMNGTTGTIYRVAPTIRIIESFGCFTQTSAYALPATATFATVASAYLPLFGLTSRTSL